MYQNQAYTQVTQKRNIVDQVREKRRGEGSTAETQNEGFAPV